MKQIILSFMLLATVTSCVESQSKKDRYPYDMDSLRAVREKEALQKEALQKSYKDSTVYLSFSGIKLGEPFRKTISVARSEGKIRNVKFDKDGVLAKCKADLFLPKREEPIEVDVEIKSYQDTIASFVVISTKYETREIIRSLYNDIYNKDAAEVKEKTDYWGDRATRNGYTAWIWTFKNQSITFSSNYEEKREHYVKDPKMRNPNNRYGVRYSKIFKSISILYSDTHYSKKVKEYEDQLAAEEEKLQKALYEELNAKERAREEEQKTRATSQDI